MLDKSQVLCEKIDRIYYFVQTQTETKRKKLVIFSILYMQLPTGLPPPAPYSCHIQHNNVICKHHGQLTDLICHLGKQNGTQS